MNTPFHLLIPAPAMFRLLLLPFFLLPFRANAQQTVGIFLNDTSSFQGYTLFGNNETTYLIDNCGHIVHTWQSEYKPGQSKYLLENGNLLQAVKIAGPFNAGGSGGRFELFNWEGSLLWHYEYATGNLHAHHDLAPLPNGHFLFTAWEKHSQEEARQMGRQYNGEVWSERIVEIKRVGANEAAVVWEWRLWDHLIQDKDPLLPNYGVISDHPERVDINFIGEGFETSGNWVHLNAIDYNADLGQIAVSSRNFSEIWIIDHSTTTAEAATHSGGKYGKGGGLLYRFGNPQVYGRGNSLDKKLNHQHDIRWIRKGLPHEGKLMAFNNDYGVGSSSVQIWAPPITANGDYTLTPNRPYGPEHMDWAYTAPGFYSRYVSGAHMLPNGNVFICEGMDGRFFEVNPEKEIVWEYINPVNPNGSPISQGGTVRMNQTFRATRYAPDYPAFEGRALSPGLPVEINPWALGCKTIGGEPADTTIIPVKRHISIIGNPIHEVLRIESGYINQLVHLTIFDAWGRQVYSTTIGYGFQSIDSSGFRPGLYFLRFANGKNLIGTEKIVKQ